MADLIDRGNRIEYGIIHSIAKSWPGYWQDTGLQKALFRLSE